MHLISLLLIGFVSPLLIPSNPFGWDEQSTANRTSDETVKLVIDFGSRREKIEMEEIPYQEDMTVADVLKAAKEQDDTLRFRHRGEHETWFLLEIAGFANEGARGDNWIFRVDDELGDRSAAIVPVPAGATVTWKLGSYRIRRSP